MTRAGVACVREPTFIARLVDRLATAAACGHGARLAQLRAGLSSAT